MMFLTFAGILSTTRAGVVSLDVLDAQKNVQAVFLDWDKTLTVDDLSGEVRDEACGGAEYPACNCAPNCDDPMIMVTAFKRAFAKEDLVSTFGNQTRLDQVKTTIRNLQKPWHGKPASVHVVSTSWFPISAKQWAIYLDFASKTLDLGFDVTGTDNAILTLADPGPGKPADKGAAIKAKMAKLGLTGKPDAVFADDSHANILTAEGICETLWVKERKGLTGTDRAYMETLVAAQLPMGGPDLFQLLNKAFDVLEDRLGVPPSLLKGLVQDFLGDKFTVGQLPAQPLPNRLVGRLRGERQSKGLVQPHGQMQISKSAWHREGPKTITDGEYNPKNGAKLAASWESPTQLKASDREYRYRMGELLDDGNW